MFQRLIRVLIFLSLRHFCKPVSFNLERLCIDQIKEKISSNVTCLEITNYFLTRISRYNPVINALITVDNVGARESAEKLDNYFSNYGKLIGKLHCVPALIKDNILVQGLPMTLGLNVFSNSTAALDAEAVKKLRNAGAIILGKANMSPLAMGEPEEPSLKGVVSNPFSLRNSASCSSGGNAAGLAARLSVIGLSSDTTGSTTAPASVTHIVGLRPLTDSFDTSGLFPGQGPAYDTIGLMALTVNDVSTILEVLSPPNQTYQQTEIDSPFIRVGILGNLTYDTFEEKVGTSSKTHSTDFELISSFRRFHENLKNLSDVNVSVTWSDDFSNAYSNVSSKSNSVMCACISFWMNRFFAQHEMTADDGQRISNLQNLLDRVCNDTCKVSASTHVLSVWWWWPLYCSKTPQTTCPENKSVDTEVRFGRAILEENLLREFDVLVLTQNPHSVISTDGVDSTRREVSIGGRISSYPELFAQSGATRLYDIGSMFVYPSLTVPIGFTDKSFRRPDRLPVAAYFMTTPRKLPLMLSLAKRYEESYWDPKMPSNFD